MELRESIALPETGLLGQLSSLAASSDNDSVLIIQNHSNLQQEFVVYADNPEFTSGQYPDKVFTSIYQASLKVASFSGSATFILADCSPATSEEYSRCIFVVTGHAHQKFEKGVELFPSDTKLLKLGTKTSSTQSSCTITIPADSEPTFMQVDTKVKTPPKLSEGEIQIEVDTSFNHPGAEFPFVGLGVPNPSRGAIIPITVWEAIPGTMYILKPSSTWQCVRAKLRAREIVDPSIWAQKATIEFREPGMEKSIIFTENGAFTNSE